MLTRQMAMPVQGSCDCVHMLMGSDVWCSADQFAHRQHGSGVGVPPDGGLGPPGHPRRKHWRPPHWQGRHHVLPRPGDLFHHPGSILARRPSLSPSRATSIQEAGMCPVSGSSLGTGRLLVKQTCIFIWHAVWFSMAVTTFISCHNQKWS